MAATLKINTSKFNAMCRELSSLTGQPHEKVLDHEVGKVMEAAIRFTPAAQVQKMRSRFENARFTQQSPKLYTPRRERRNVKLRKGMILYDLEHRYPPELWSAIVASRKARLVKVLRTRGLAKKSWWNIARSLGINLAVPAFITRATPITGKDYPENIRVKRERHRGRSGIFISNAQPTVQFHGVRALQRAISGRVKFFKRNLRDSVFNSVAKVARKYPGVKVRV